MEALIKIGFFADELQQTIDREFTCHEPEEIAQDIGLRQSVRGLITRSNYQVPQALLESLPALQVISTCGVGYDGIQVAYTHARGIAVTHTPGVLDDAVCELGVGLLPAMLREIPASDRFVREGRWSAGAYPLTTSLAGKTVGIVGLSCIGRFAALRVRCAGGNIGKARLLPQQWLLIEWPADQAEPEKYYLSTLPETTALNDLVRAAHMRWRIERDYQDLKQDLGLGHYEGRG
jgi:phosphoglycerate dehydrogenase-like enzyme